MNSTADESSFNLNNHGLNLMSISYATYKNGNSEHRANLKTITDIFFSSVDILKSVLVIDSGTTDHMNSNQMSFKNYRTFKTAKAIYTDGSIIH